MHWAVSIHLSLVGIVLFLSTLAKAGQSQPSGQSSCFTCPPFITVDSNDYKLSSGPTTGGSEFYCTYANGFTCYYITASGQLDAPSSNEGCDSSASQCTRRRKRELSRSYRRSPKDVSIPSVMRERGKLGQRKRAHYD